MKSWLILVIFCGLTLKACIGDEVKKDHFPFMAFLYYHDAAVRNPLYEHKRFLQNAILIKPEFLLTASIIEPPVVNNKFNGFPHKTLLARIGAITVDESLQYNEDEHEQEREIVQIIRPYHYNHHVWWKSDISVLKSVTPFNVKFITFPILYGSTEQDCTTLAFVKYNTSMERQLIKYDFRILPSSQCGTDFYDATMICGDYKYDSPPPDFCEGNAGGPLICSDRLVGLQTFISSECKSPYFFQLLPKWQKFITCSISQTCHEEDCNTICTVSYKDVVENLMEYQGLPKVEEMKETLNVLPAEVTESLNDEAEVTRTSAQPVYTFNTSVPAIKITSDGYRMNIDSSDSIDKSKESEDGSGNLESMAKTTKGLDTGVKVDNKNNDGIDNSGNDLSFNAVNNHEMKKNNVAIERNYGNVLKLDDKSEENQLKTEEESDESAEADKTEDGIGTTYSFATKSLSKIALDDLDSTFSPITTKLNQMQTVSAPVSAKPLSADKELKSGEDISGGNTPSEEKTVKNSGESLMTEANKEMGAERHFDGSGGSVISAESAKSGEISVQKSAESRNDGNEANNKERSGNNSSEKTLKSADGLDLTGDITVKSTGNQSLEKIERLNGSSVEEGDSRRRVVSGKLVPPTVSDGVSISTVTTTATDKVKAKEEKPDLRTYSHGTKITYETGLIVSLFCRCLYCFYLKI